jgi:diacylglycerol kinase (ATP)
VKPGRKPQGHELFRHQAVLPRFGDAFSGVYQTYREEPNFRFHTFATTCVMLAGYAVALQGWETAYLAVSVVGVLAAELVNTAVERAVDFAAEGRRNRLAGQAKEVAAGVVLLMALHAVFAAYLIFIHNRGLLVTVQAVLHLATRQPWTLGLPLLAGVAGLWGGARETR